MPDITMLMTLILEYHELYMHAVSYLYPHDALALAHTCRHMRARICTRTQHFAKFARVLAAINHINYHIVQYYYAVVDAALTYSIQFVSHRPWSVSGNVVRMHPGSKLIVYNCARDVVIRVDPYVCEHDKYWYNKVFTAWLTRRVHFYNLLQLYHVWMKLDYLLTTRSLAELTLTSRKCAQEFLNRLQSRATDTLSILN